MNIYYHVIDKAKEETDECLTLAIARNTGGYLICRWEGKKHLATRLIWEHFNGPIPDEMHVCHTCDVRHCINPRHLFLGTKADNQADMARKGRGNKKLTIKEVKEIRRLYKNTDVTVRELAFKYDVSQSLVYKIITRQRRNHV